MSGNVSYHFILNDFVTEGQSRRLPKLKINPSFGGMFIQVFKSISIIIFLNGIKRLYLCGPEVLFNPSVTNLISTNKQTKIPLTTVYWENRSI